MTELVIGAFIGGALGCLVGYLTGYGQGAWQRTGSMTEWIFLRKLVYKLLGVSSVLLFDHDGEIHIRFARRLGPRLYAWRQGMGVRRVLLHPDGKTTGASYVHGWEPLIGEPSFPPSNESPTKGEG